MLRYPSSFVTAAYRQVRLVPRDSGAWPLALFTKPSEKIIFQTFSEVIHLDDVVKRVNNGIMPESQELNLSFEELVTEGASALGLSLGNDMVASLRSYGEEILFWNRSVNLVFAKTLNDLAVRHFIDSLTVLPLLPRKPFSLLDMGTGAGLPGIPLKMERPDAAVFLVDASRKKTSFLKQVIRKVGLAGIQAEQGRIEDWISRGIHRTAFDIVLSRATFHLPLFLDRASRFVKDSGSIIAMKGKSFRDELKDAEKTLFEKNLVLAGHVPLFLPFIQEERHLLVFRIRGERGSREL